MIIGWSKSKEKFIQENAFKQKREKPELKCNAGLALVGFPSIGCDLAAVHIIGVSTRLELTVLARDDFKRVPVNRLEQINALKQLNKAQLTRFFLYKAPDKTRNVCNQSFKRVK